MSSITLYAIYIQNIRCLEQFFHSMTGVKFGGFWDWIGSISWNLCHNLYMCWMKVQDIQRVPTHLTIVWRLFWFEIYIPGLYNLTKHWTDSKLFPPLWCRQYSDSWCSLSWFFLQSFTQIWCANNCTSFNIWYHKTFKNSQLDLVCLCFYGGGWLSWKKTAKGQTETPTSHSLFSFPSFAFSSLSVPTVGCSITPSRHPCLREKKGKIFKAKSSIFTWSSAWWSRVLDLPSSSPPCPFA